MEKITVLFLGCTSDIGGAPKSMISMVKNLRDKYEIIPIVVTPLTNGVINKFCKDNQIECYVIPYQDACFTLGSNKIKNLIKIIFSFITKKIYKKSNQSALKAIDDIIKNKKVDIIHTNINRITLGNLISKKYNIPQIVHIREFGKEDYHLSYYDSDVIDQFNNNCEKFVAISDAVKDCWIKKGIDINKITKVYNGIDVSTKKVNKISYQERINAVFCGTFIHSKGQIQVLKAIKILPKEIKEKIHVDFYGKGQSKYFEFIKFYVKIYKLEKYVSFQKYVNDIEKKLSNYNLGFMCSTKEGFGRVTIEYMINGIPVIASNTGANPEIIRHKENGFLYEYNNIKDLKNKILEVYREKNINKITATARKDVEKYFSSCKNAQEIYSLYKEILKKFSV